MPVNFEGMAATDLQVRASGDWTIDLKPPSAVRSFGLGQTISETRSSVIHYTGSASTAHITENSPAEFMIYAYSADTSFDAVMMYNDGGVADASVPIVGNTYLEVYSDEPWSITVTP